MDVGSRKDPTEKLTFLERLMGRAIRWTADLTTRYDRLFSGDKDVKRKRKELQKLDSERIKLQIIEDQLISLYKDAMRMEKYKDPTVKLFFTDEKQPQDKPNDLDEEEEKENVDDPLNESEHFLASLLCSTPLGVNADEKPHGTYLFDEELRQCFERARYEIISEIHIIFWNRQFKWQAKIKKNTTPRATLSYKYLPLNLKLFCYPSLLDLHNVFVTFR